MILDFEGLGVEMMTRVNLAKGIASTGGRRCTTSVHRILASEWKMGVVDVSKHYLLALALTRTRMDLMATNPNGNGCNIIKA